MPETFATPSLLFIASINHVHCAVSAFCVQHPQLSSFLLCMYIFRLHHQTLLLLFHLRPRSCSVMMHFLVRGDVGTPSFFSRISAALEFLFYLSVLFVCILLACYSFVFLFWAALRLEKRKERWVQGLQEKSAFIFWQVESNVSLLLACS